MNTEKEDRFILEEACPDCGNESGRTVDMQRITDKLDRFFARDDLAGAEKLLLYWENESRTNSDDRGLLQIRSEQIGFYRRTGEKDKALAAVDEALSLIGKLGLETTVSGATIMLNAATTMKAFGLARKALDWYAAAGEIYRENLEPEDFRMAGFYNNLATALSELGLYSDAKESYTKAAKILEQRGDADGELAVTYVNMAYLPDCDSEKFMKAAWALLDSDKLPRDGNYAFIASKCAPAFGQFGMTAIRDELNKRKEEIYAGS